MIAAGRDSVGGGREGEDGGSGGPEEEGKGRDERYSFHLPGLLPHSVLGYQKFMSAMITSAYQVGTTLVLV